MGKRGPKKGAIYKPTLEKAAAQEITRKIITAALEPMLRAQIANAQGIGHLFTRDANMKFSRIVDEDEMLRVINEGTQGKDFWIFLKDPSTQAFSELMDRALDQARKPPEEHHHTGEIDLISKLSAGRAKARALRSQI